MDKATAYLLIQEGKIEQLQSSLKVILPNIQSVLMKPDNNRIKAILKRLPQKNLRDVEKDAIRQIPGFKKDYLTAQRKVKKLKLHPYMNKPAAAATALVSSTTRNSVDDVLNNGNMSLRKIKITSFIPGAQFLPLIQFGLFVVFIGAMFITGGEALIPTLKLIGKAALLLLNMLSGVLKTLLEIGSEQGAAAASSWFPTLSGSSLGDMPIDQFIRSAADLIKFVPES